MSEMVERVARAMHDRNRRQQVVDCLGAGYEIPKTRYEFMFYDDLPADARWLMNEIARVAISAMREPTEAMLNAARDWSVAKNGIGVGNDQATGCFQAMIDAALAGAPASLSTGSTKL